MMWNLGVTYIHLFQIKVPDVNPIPHKYQSQMGIDRIVEQTRCCAFKEEIDSKVVKSRSYLVKTSSTYS